MSTPISTINFTSSLIYVIAFCRCVNLITITFLTIKNITACVNQENTAPFVQRNLSVIVRVYNSIEIYNKGFSIK
uniref:Clone 1609 transcribed RNA sequence n=1 Tax=Plectreurys tristis TaxID=33319 RepID=A0A0C4W5S9_PLETR|nr:hypothetical protein [Plectreurys tristis]